MAMGGLQTRIVDVGNVGVTNLLRGEIIFDDELPTRPGIECSDSFIPKSHRGARTTAEADIDFGDFLVKLAQHLFPGQTGSTSSCWPEKLREKTP